MDKITNERIESDRKLISDMLDDYKNAIYCPQNINNENDFDHQSKLVRIALVDLRSALFNAREALNLLTEIKVKE